jgi:hypothetical protein
LRYAFPACSADRLPLRQLSLELALPEHAALLARHTGLETLSVTVISTRPENEFLFGLGEEIDRDRDKQSAIAAFNALGESLRALSALRSLTLDAPTISEEPLQLPRSVKILVGSALCRPCLLTTS